MPDTAKHRGIPEPGMPNGVEAGVHDDRQLEPALRDRLIRRLRLPTSADNWGVNLDGWRATFAGLEE
jgi:hypothetical protein